MITTYYMSPKVRQSIGYPGQENVSYNSKATQAYLVDGSLAKVIARGRKYRLNSRTLIPARRRKRKSCPVSRSSIRASRR